MRAKNSLKWGEYSETVQIRAGLLPSKIDALLPEVRSTYPDTGFVWVYWNKPEVEEGGDPVKSYTVKIITKDNGEFTETLYSGDIFEYSKPISEIGILSKVEIQVRANNDDGYGEYSDVSTMSTPLRELPIPQAEIIQDP